MSKWVGFGSKRLIQPSFEKNPQWGLTFLTKNFSLRYEMDYFLAVCGVGEQGRAGLRRVLFIIHILISQAV